MFFDFYDDRPDYEALTREYVRLEDLLHLIIAVSVAFFLDIVGVIVMIYLASLPPSDAAKRAAMAAAQREPNPRFVFMSPAIDRQSKTASARAPASDANRRAASRERAPNPTNEHAVLPRQHVRDGGAAVHHGAPAGPGPAGPGLVPTAGPERGERAERVAVDRADGPAVGNAARRRSRRDGRPGPVVGGRRQPVPLRAGRRVQQSWRGGAASRRPTSSSTRRASSSGRGCAGSSPRSSATG